MSAITKDEREALTEFSKKWGPLFGENSSNSTITVHGASSWQLTVCLLCAALGMAFGFFGLYVAADTKAEMRAERQSREVMAGWTSQELTAIRSYITSGKLAPMTPRPFGQPQEQP